MMNINTIFEFRRNEPRVYTYIEAPEGREPRGLDLRLKFSLVCFGFVAVAVLGIWMMHNIFKSLLLPYCAAEYDVGGITPTKTRHVGALYNTTLGEVLLKSQFFFLFL